MGFKLLCTDVFSPPAPMVLGSDSKPHLTSRCFAILKKGEQASKQRCTFSPTTFSSVQFSSGGAMFICVLLASGSFSFLGTPNHMVQPRNGHWYSAVSSSTRSHQRGGGATAIPSRCALLPNSASALAPVAAPALLSGEALPLVEAEALVVAVAPKAKSVDVVGGRRIANQSISTWCF